MINSEKGLKINPFVPIYSNINKKANKCINVDHFLRHFAALHGVKNGKLCRR